MIVIFEPVREAEGECTWEGCTQKDAQAWRVTIRRDNDVVRSWTYKDRDRAAVACADLAQGRPQPLNVTVRMATTSTRTVYLP